MGYCVSQIGSSFFMKAADQEAALYAVKRWVRTRTKISWVDRDIVLSRGDLAEAFFEFGYVAEVDDDGNIVDIVLDREKWGEERLLFGVIGPWVRVGSYIRYVDEEGAHFQVRWSGGRGVVTEYAEIAWPDDESHAQP